MEKQATSMSILPMPEWKHKVLNAVAWLLGMRGEHVACITFNFDYRNIETFNSMSDACQDCCIDSCKVCSQD
jgi:hypothetical protein